MALKLFRRHCRSCTQRYAKEDRIYETDSPKRTGRAQCNCPIAVDGRLGVEYLKAKSTGATDWIAARRIVDGWQISGAVKAISHEPPYELRSVGEAVQSFFMVQRNKGVSEDRMKQHSQLLTLRLLPFSTAKGIEYIQEMDKALIWAQFRDSWKNKNPLRNRRLADADVMPKLEIGKRTASRMISDLRIFLNHCVSNEWLSENWASKQHGMVTTKFKDPKEPFSDADISYVYRAAEYVTDGKGYGSKRTSTQNGFEAFVFVLVLRYTGLRISDVCMLKTSQLVPFPHGGWTHAISCHPIKTSTTRGIGNHVLIPIPNGSLPGHPNVVSALQALPVKHGEYFFLGGREVPADGTPAWRSRMRYATNGWRERINRLFKIARALMIVDGKQFSVHPHPHRFRHTFCAWLLCQGMSLRTVASYIGDTEDTVRAHYGRFSVAEQAEAARVFGEAIRKDSVTSKASPGTPFPWQQLQQGIS